MHEILFRGKSIEKDTKGKWIYGFYWEFNTYKGLNYFIDSKGDNEGFFIDTKTAGQYTGLQDKNGVKIFEGDIVKDKDILHDGEIQMEGVISEVKFNNGCWIISSADFGWGFLHTNCNTITVIGNIYDNPELLGSMNATN